MVKSVFAALMVAALMVGAVGGNVNSTFAAKPGDQYSQAAKSSKASFAAWKKWVGVLVGSLKKVYNVRGVNFNGKSQTCTFIMSRGKQNYVCEVRDFKYTIRAVQ